LFFALTPLWLRFLVQRLEPSPQLSRVQGIVGVIGLLATGVGTYALFVR